MIRVVILGSSSDNSIASALLQSVGRKACVEAFGKFGVVEKGSGRPQVVLFDTERLDRIDDRPTVLVFKKGFCGEIPQITEKCTAVLDESNTALLNSMLKFPFPSICCGMSQRNTLTVASIRSGEALVSLQREITAIDGRVIEPSEISVIVGQGCEYYTLLAVTAVHLLIGMEDTAITL